MKVYMHFIRTLEVDVGVFEERDSIECKNEYVNMSNWVIIIIGRCGNCHCGEQESELTTEMLFAGLSPTEARVHEFVWGWSWWHVAFSTSSRLHGCSHRAVMSMCSM